MRGRQRYITDDIVNNWKIVSVEKGRKNGIYESICLCGNERTLAFRTACRMEKNPCCMYCSQQERRRQEG